MGQTKTATISAQNQWTGGVQVNGHGTLRASGTFGASVVTLQRSDDGGTTWVDTGDTVTTTGVYPFTDYTSQLYRAGVKTGQFDTEPLSLWIGGE